MLNQLHPLFLISLSLLLVPTANSALTHDPALEWNTLESEHFYIHFHDGEAALARETAAVAEQAHQRLSPFFDWEPEKKTDLILSDERDFAGGHASPVPHNRTTIFVSPAAAESMSSTDDWMERLIFHEYTHILHLDKAKGAPHALRRIFGRLILLFPGLMQPAWGIEGLASYMEYDGEYGAASRGPAGDTLFEAIMRLEVARGIKPLRQVNQSLVTWPGFLTRYIYGVYFFHFIEARYGKEAVQRLANGLSRNLIPFRINNNAVRAVGKNLDQLWGEFSSYLHELFDPQIQALKSSLNQGEAVTGNGRVSGPLAAAGNTIYYIVDDGRHHIALWQMSPGMPAARIREAHPGARIDAHPEAGILLAQPELCHNTSRYYDLYRVDADSGSLQRLTHCARYLQARWDPNGKRIAAVKNHRGAHRIDLLDADGNFMETIWQGEAWSVVGGLDWSPDGTRIVASIRQRGKGTNLHQFDAIGGSWQQLTHTKEQEAYPRYSGDGDSILFSANYGGISNIHRLNLSSGETETLTRVLGGASQPAQTRDGRIAYLNLVPTGVEIFQIKSPSPVAGVLATAAEPIIVPTSVEKDYPIRPYSPLRSVRPFSWFPFLAIDKDQAILGISTNGADALNRHQYAASFGIDGANQIAVGRLDYIYDRLFPTIRFSLSRDADYFRDTEDELNRIRYDDTAEIDLIFPWLRVDNRLSLQLGALYNRNSDAERFRSAPLRPDYTDNLLGIAASWDSSDRYAYSISPESGRSLTLVAESGAPLDSDFDGEVYRLDWREYISLGNNHVLAARIALGRGEGKTTVFELGGEFSDFPTLIGPSPFNVRDFSLRGYPDGLANLIGQDMNLGSLEWRFPIRLIERGWMAPPLGLNRLSGAAFVEAGSVWDDNADSDDYHTGAGLELNAETRLFYHIPLQLRLGYAHGFDLGGEDRIYLNIGSAF
ncbi:MAG: BamA/TamA family outer membrane protein [Pseudomonadota bacterium]